MSTQGIPYIVYRNMERNQTCSVLVPRPAYIYLPPPLLKQIHVNIGTVEVMLVLAISGGYPGGSRLGKTEEEGGGCR